MSPILLMPIMVPMAPDSAMWRSRSCPDHFNQFKTGGLGAVLEASQCFGIYSLTNETKGKNKFFWNYVSCRPGHLKIRAQSLAAIECGLAGNSLGVFEPLANSVQIGLIRRRSLLKGSLRSQNLAAIECGLAGNSLGCSSPRPILYKLDLKRRQNLFNRLSQGAIPGRN